MGKMSSEKDGNKEFWFGWEKWVLMSFDLEYGKNKGDFEGRGGVSYGRMM